MEAYCQHNNNTNAESSQKHKHMRTIWAQHHSSKYWFLKALFVSVFCWISFLPQLCINKQYETIHLPNMPLLIHSFFPTSSAAADRSLSAASPHGLPAGQSLEFVGGCLHFLACCRVLIWNGLTVASTVHVVENNKDWGLGDGSWCGEDQAQMVEPKEDINNGDVKTTQTHVLRREGRKTFEWWSQIFVEVKKKTIWNIFEVFLVFKFYRLIIYLLLICILLY